MHFLMPHLFRSQAEFKTWFANPMTQAVEGGSAVDRSLVQVRCFPTLARAHAWLHDLCSAACAVLATCARIAFVASPRMPLLILFPLLQRLHAVLRPFVLRRLKSEVATQMPKKYEHIVMCRLSARQRFLYEDFMSRSSTRATLAGGNFMSMMNVLMQLRKVCNHPDLFEPRPILSPLELPTLSLRLPACVIDARTQFGFGFTSEAALLLSGHPVPSAAAANARPNLHALLSDILTHGAGSGAVFDAVSAWQQGDFNGVRAAPQSGCRIATSLLSPTVCVEQQCARRRVKCITIRAARINFVPHFLSAAYRSLLQQQQQQQPSSSRGGDEVVDEAVATARREESVLRVLVRAVNHEEATLTPATDECSSFAFAAGLSRLPAVVAGMGLAQRELSGVDALTGAEISRLALPSQAFTA
ncbi:MAG: hypothetical protein EOO65_04430, partial [Methanosarcinales archaeon]